MEPLCVERARARVVNGHGLVAAGRYDEALAILGPALDDLRRQLGASHPEVEELEADVEAVRQMREVHDFGREAGFRDWKGPARDV